MAQISLIIHILAGILTLVSGPIAIFYNFKNTKLHRLFGKIFFWAMNVVCFSAVIGWLKHIDVAFYQFLLGIAIIVWAGILRGVRAIFVMKGSQIIRFDYVYTILLAMFALWMLGMSVYHFQQKTMIAIPILFGVFGTGAMTDVRKNFQMYKNTSKYSKKAWLALHISSMLGAFTASTTAFTVNAAHFLPWYLQWFGPTLCLLPLQIYWGRKMKEPLSFQLPQQN
jgi:uncharacterized membrane protein